MKSTQQLHDPGQSLWLDNITRGILNDGTLLRHINELSVTGQASFDASWKDLLGRVAAKRAMLAQHAAASKP